MGTIVINFDAAEPEALHVLSRARELIEDPVNWVQGPYAVDDYGQPVDYDHPKACAWCALGAVWAVGDSERVNSDVALDILNRVALRQGQPGIHWLSDDDETDHEDVLAAFDRAIEIAIGEGGDE